MNPTNPEDRRPGTEASCGGCGSHDRHEHHVASDDVWGEHGPEGDRDGGDDKHQRSSEQPLPPLGVREAHGGDHADHHAEQRDCKCLPG